MPQTLPMPAQVVSDAPVPHAKLILEVVEQSDELVVTLVNRSSKRVEVSLVGDSPGLTLKDANILMKPVSAPERLPRSAHRLFEWGVLENGASVTKRFLRSDFVEADSPLHEPRVYAECEVKIDGSSAVVLSNHLVLFAR